MTCEHCTAARQARWHGQYRTDCAGCLARSISRSLAMHNAVRLRTPEAFADLRETITRMLPAQPYEQARAAVIDWWRHDHPTEGKS